MFRLLQVAVAAPWLYHISNNKKTPVYFRHGLKLLAGVMVGINAPPLYEAYKEHSEIIRRMYAEQMRKQQRGEVIDAEIITDQQTVSG